ncbi:hypothetical protein [Arhodomonas sp. AD133]|uniref:hypothetical protein n=1 Tax=Arhodomonas sp. AD133 TaxID=3415009 RepID=UPI003EBD78A8
MPRHRAAYRVATMWNDAAAGLEQTLRDYNRINNHHIPQRVLHHRTSVQTLKAWQQNRPELFRKQVGEDVQTT